MNQLKSNFEVIQCDCGGIDGLIVKLQLRATVPGIVADSTLLGLPVTIKSQAQTGFRKLLNTVTGAKPAVDPEETSLTNEVKRIGFLIDRYVDL
jgi:hypothetical protein